jgi:glycosyltransferase involved in cell wall biosynthesis
VKRRVERRVYRRAARFVVLSAAFGRILQGRYGVAPWRIEVLAPGVDVERFTPGDEAAARTSLGLPDGRVALCVRRLVPRMGLEALLDAWASLDPSGTDRLVLAGEGPLRAALEARARSLGVARTVTFLGLVSDRELVDAYRAADVTVVPSLSLEGFGLVVLESLACGTPVVGTDAGGLAEALEVTRQRSAVPAGDVDALAGALRDAVVHPPTREERVACRLVAEEHAWPLVAHRHEALYRAVAAGQPTPSVVVLDHTSVLSGGELAIARALDGVHGRAAVHAILATDGPLVARLESAGASVEVLELDDETRRLPRDEVSAWRLRPRAAMTTVRYVVSLAHRLRQLHPDVVHTNSLKSALYGGAAARIAGVPCVWHVRDRIESPYLPKGAVRLVRAAARVLPSVVVANSPSTLEALGVAGRVVPSPLDPSIAPTPPPQRDVPAFLVLGRLAPWKGQHLAIEAFASAFPTGGATMRIAGAALFGEERYAASLPALAERLGVADRVELCGFVEDVASLLEGADVVVHSSVLAEPFGQTVLEAMGAGRPVIAAGAGGAAELVTDGVDGLHYVMGDRDALAWAMRRLAGDRALRASLGEAASRTARRYTPAALAPDLLSAWQAAARGKRGGGA